MAKDCNDCLWKDPSSWQGWLVIWWTSYLWDLKYSWSLYIKRMLQNQVIYCLNLSVSDLSKSYELLPPFSATPLLLLHECSCPDLLFACLFFYPSSHSFKERKSWYTLRWKDLIFASQILNVFPPYLLLSRFYVIAIVKWKKCQHF